MLNPLTHKRILKKGIPGQATIVAMGVLDRNSTTFNLPITFHVFVEGRAPYEVSDQWWVKAKYASGLNGTIPVRVDPDDPQKVAIDWDGVRAKEAAETTARREALAAQGPWSGSLPPNVTVEGDLGAAEIAALGSALGSIIGSGSGQPQAPPSEQTASVDLRNDPVLREKLERVLGRKLTPGTSERVAENDPEMQMKIMQVVNEHMAEQAAAQAPMSSPAPDADSTLDQLERLAELRDRGVIDESEFQLQKDRILNQG